MATDNRTPEGLLADTGAPICVIPCTEAFSALTADEKRYAHHLCRASFHGTRILLNQTSEESEVIFDLIMGLHEQAGGDWNRLAAKAGIDKKDINYFLEYAAMFLGNVGNYRSTGDQKFVPRISRSEMKKLCALDGKTQELFDRAAQKMYSIEPSRYGYPSSAEFASGYYPGQFPVDKTAVEEVQKFLDKNGLLPENTRVTKRGNGDEITVLLASAETTWQPDLKAAGNSDAPNAGSIRLEFGDFHDPLSVIVRELQSAREYAASDLEKEMLLALIDSFRNGDHKRFKSAQAAWVQNHSPTVEPVIGFIETYQDPHGVRGAWEGIVAVVNKAQSKKFSELVSRSEDFIKLLPWNGTLVGLTEGQLSVFETTRFVTPDFTSLDTIGFVKSESPAGLNLPNFQDIIDEVGSKNLEFGNVNNANPVDQVIPFIRKDDIDLVRRCREKAFELKVGCHELLGHGSGRLLIENAPGKYNFEPDKLPIDPTTGKQVASWYKPDETWYGVFGSIANAVEECRAEGVALLLLPNKDILDIFGYSEVSDPSATDVVYAGFLDFIQGTLKGLSSWNPESKKWGQSHRRANFALLKCMLEAGPELLQLIEVEDDIQVILERSKIETLAIPAIAKLLLRLQVWRSTANVSDCTTFLTSYTEIDDRFARYRSIVLAKGFPRIQYVQPNTVVEGGEVRLQDYPATKEGLIQSWAERRV